MLSDNLGHAAMKTSAVSAENQVIEAPAVIFESQYDVASVFEAGLLDHDCVAVVRHQGPKANRIPELRKLMPPFGILLGRCFKIALATDGRLSDASGRVLSTIHVTPEIYDSGLLAKVRDRDIIRVNRQVGELTLLVNEVKLATREPHTPGLSTSHVGTGRELFGTLREKLSGAEQGTTYIAFRDDEFVIKQEKIPMKNWKISVEPILTTGPVVPVIMAKKLEHVMPMVKALVAGGVRVLEVTLRTEYAVDAIRAIAKEVPETIVGVDTVLNPQQLAEATEVGTQFAISLGLTEPLLKAVIEGTTPLIPEISTVFELMLGMDCGLKEFKFFPAEANGGMEALQTTADPLSQVRFCPTDDISPVNYHDYLVLKSVLCIGGSWLVSADALGASDYDRITKLARKVVEGTKL